MVLKLRVRRLIIYVSNTMKRNTENCTRIVLDSNIDSTELGWLWVCPPDVWYRGSLGWKRARRLTVGVSGVIESFFGVSDGVSALPYIAYRRGGCHGYLGAGHSPPDITPGHYPPAI